MKNKLLRLAFVAIFAFLMIGCSDNDELNPAIPENKMLAVTDTACLMFKSVNGSAEGGVDGLEISKYKERHLRKMNYPIFTFDELVKESSITFIGETNKVKINGYINCGYVAKEPYLFISVVTVNDGVYDYKFENNALKILVNPKKDEWVILGYGNKEK